MNRIKVLLVAAVAWSMLLVRAAPAQDEFDADDAVSIEHDIGDWDGTRLRQADIDSMARVVGMTPEQRAAATDLYMAYETAMQSAGRKLAEFQQSLTEQGGGDDPEVWKKSQPVYEKYNEHVRKLRESLIEDLKLTLTADQVGQWPKVERRLKRKESMSQLMASGARSDLVALVERAMAGQPMPEDLAQTLDDYERDMDRALSSAGSWREEQEAMWRDRAQEFMSMSMEERMEMTRKFMEEGMKRSRGVRDVNMRYLKRIAEQLPEDKRIGFEDEFYRRSFWALAHEGYSPGGGQSSARAFEAIAKADWVSEVKRGKVREVRRQYDAERRAMRDKQVAAIIEAEDKPRTDANPYGVIGMDPQEMAQTWERRRELERKTLDRLREIFTDEELQKLPPPLKRATEIKDVDFDD